MFTIGCVVILYLKILSKKIIQLFEPIKVKITLFYFKLMFPTPKCDKLSNIPHFKV